MVSRQDIRDVNGEAQKLIDAIDEIQELYQDSQNPDITVNDAAYADAQEEVKQAVADLWTVANDMVDRTDQFDPPGDDAAITLPNAGLSRGTDSTNAPEDPGA